jgi:hypothetical protein
MNNKFNNIETLLNLDGVVIEQAGGHWTKFEAREVPKTDGIPHGIRYSLTLHDRTGKRMMGFDNAHAVKIKGNNKRKYQGRKTFDHRHRNSEDEGVFYLFTNAHQLLKDFWLEVDKVLNSLGLEQEKLYEKN